MLTPFTLAFLVIDLDVATRRSSAAHGRGDRGLATQFDTVAAMTDQAALETDHARRSCRIPSYLD